MSYLTHNRIVLTIIAFSLSCTSMFAQEGWTWTTVDSGVESRLRATRMGPDSFGVAVGDDSTVLKYDGKKWEPVGGEILTFGEDGDKAFPFSCPTGQGGLGTDARLDAVALMDSQSFWIGGYGMGSDQRGMWLWNGTYWSPREAGPSNDRTLALWSDGFDIVLAGRGAPGRINRYDGKKWKIVLEGSIGFFRDIHGQLGSTLWACGHVSLEKGGRTTFLNIVRSLDNGVTWEPDPQIQASPAGEMPWNAVYSLGDSLLWSAGNSGQILFWNGSTAEVIDAMSGPSSRKRHLNGVCALSSQKVWAIGDQGTILFSNGESWTPVETSIENIGDLHEITSDGQGGLWIVGDAGLILHGQPTP